MFTTPAFILKNTPELRAKLEELGYVKISLSGTAILTINTDVGWHYAAFNADNLTSKMIQLLDGSIDCGTNEKLFLALSALREDSDYMQWFVSNVPIRRGCISGNLVSENDMYYDWILSKVDKVTAKLRHKATPDELIKHFTKVKEKDNLKRLLHKTKSD